jgi:hypothetical protein
VTPVCLDFALVSYLCVPGSSLRVIQLLHVMFWFIFSQFVSQKLIQVLCIYLEHCLHSVSFSQCCECITCSPYLCCIPCPSHSSLFRNIYESRKAGKEFAFYVSNFCVKSLTFKWIKISCCRNWPVALECFWLFYSGFSHKFSQFNNGKLTDHLSVCYHMWVFSFQVTSEPYDRSM